MGVGIAGQGGRIDTGHWACLRVQPDQLSGSKFNVGSSRLDQGQLAGC